MLGVWWDVVRVKRSRSFSSIRLAPLADPAFPHVNGDVVIHSLPLMLTFDEIESVPNTGMASKGVVVSILDPSTTFIGECGESNGVRTEESVREADDADVVALFRGVIGSS
jgi:hypothetical protein